MAVELFSCPFGKTMGATKQPTLKEDAQKLMKY
jgi:hypothetical protein